MHCTQCGTLNVTDAKFCSQCGSPISAGMSQKPSEAPPVAANFAKPRTLYIVGLVLVGIPLVANYAIMFGLAFAGQSVPHVGQWGFFLILWTGLFFYLWWKLRRRNGWHGALIGLACGFLAFTVAAFIRGFVIAAGA